MLHAVFRHEAQKEHHMRRRIMMQDTNELLHFPSTQGDHSMTPDDSKSAKKEDGFCPPSTRNRQRGKQKIRRMSLDKKR